MSVHTVEMPDTFSVSRLWMGGMCTRWMGIGYEVDSADESAAIGRILHEIAELAARTAAARGVEMLTAVQLEWIAREVLRRGTRALSDMGWQTVMRLAPKLGYVHDDHPPFPMGLKAEVPITRILDGRRITMRLDWLWFDEGGVPRIRDWKTGGRKAADEPTFALKSYAWGLLGEHPDIEGAYVAEHALPYGGPQWLWLGREAIEEHQEYLSDLLARIVTAYERQEFPPTPGSHCDSMCPDRAGCPLPEWAKGRGIRSDVDATEAVDAIVKLRADASGLTRAVKGWLVDNELTEVRGSGDMVYGASADGSKFDVHKARVEEA